MTDRSTEASKVEALTVLGQAMKALRKAKKLGIDVKPAKPLMEQAARAVAFGDYANAIRLGGEVLRRFGGPT